MLDELEDVLYSETNADITILAAHHTSDTFWPQALRSKNGRSFKDMMEKVDGFVNGHLHPKNPRIDPFGKTMEYTGLALRTHTIYQLLAVDNQVISYHALDPEAPDLAVVTFPVPHRQLRVIGSQTNIAVRILAFTDKLLTFHVSGAATGTLERRREIVDDVWLYSLPISLGNGIHTIKISGDLEKEIEFAIGTKTESFSYTQTRDMNGWAVIMLIVFFAVFYAMVFTGMFLRGKWAKPFKEAHNWQKGKIDESHWLVTLLLSPIVIGRHLRKAPMHCRILVLVLTIWGFTMPIAFFGLEGYVGIMWIFSFAVAGAIVPDIVMLLEAGNYLFFICPVFLNTMSLYDFDRDWSFLVDLIIGAGMWGGGQYVWFWLGAANAADYVYLASFEFFIFPVVFVAFAVYTYAQRWMCFGPKPVQNEVLP
jgi:hypothetical protein